MTTTRTRTGPSPEVIALMLTRDGYRCVVGQVCKGESDILVPGHRINRGQGGSSHPDRHALSGLISNCPWDNTWLEDHPAVAYGAGWKIRHGITKPSEVPILYPDGRWWHLDDHGNRHERLEEVL